MNMMQKMGIDPNTLDGVKDIWELSCTDIPDELGKRRRGTDCGQSRKCSECMALRLFAKVPAEKVQRGTTYTDFKKAWEDYTNTGAGKYGFAYWLAEEIEVEDD